MLGLITGALGAVYGWYRATKAGGDTGDKAQYAFGFGVAFGLAGFFLALFLVQAGIA